MPELPLALLIAGASFAMQKMLRPKAVSGYGSGGIVEDVVKKTEVVFNADQLQSVEALRRMQKAVSVTGLSLIEKRNRVVERRTNCINCGAPLNGNCDHCGTKYR